MIHLRNKVNLPILNLGRLRTIALETLKSINKLAPVYIRDLVNVRLSNYSFRYGNMLQIPLMVAYDSGHSVSRLQGCGTASQMSKEMCLNIRNSGG